MGIFGRKLSDTDLILQELRWLRQDLNVIGDEMAKGLDDLRAAVAAQSTVNESAVALLQGISQKLNAAIAGDDDDAVEEIAKQLEAQTAQLAAAVAANTPAASPAPSAPAADAAGASNAAPAADTTGNP